MNTTLFFLFLIFSFTLVCWIIQMVISAWRLLFTRNKTSKILNTVQCSINQFGWDWNKTSTADTKLHEFPPFLVYSTSWRWFSLRNWIDLGHPELHQSPACHTVLSIRTFHDCGNLSFALSSVATTWGCWTLEIWTVPQRNWVVVTLS